jgi:hypothetical protein
VREVGDDRVGAVVRAGSQRHLVTGGPKVGTQPRAEQQVVGENVNPSHTADDTGLLVAA